MLCECGCGNPTRVAAQNRPDRGFVKGQPQRFILGHIARAQHLHVLTRKRCRQGHDLTVPSACDAKGYCRTCTSDARKRFYRQNAATFSANQRRRKLATYGLTEAEYQRLADAQGGLCAICGGPPKLRKGVARLHVDHDHNTGRVRGLLCYDCNWALGKFSDSVEGLLRAVAYLSK